MENEITVNGVTYYAKNPANYEGLEYCIVRTYSAGVFAGYYKHHAGKEGTVFNARRLWYWSGANSLSQLACEGVKNKSDCKFAMEVNSVFLTEVIEVIPCTNKAMDNIAEVPVWKQ